MKKRFLVIAALIGLLAACQDPASNNPDTSASNPPAQEETVIVFDNTQGICAVVVYNDDQRRDEYKIAEIPAGASSQEFEWTPGTSVAFYFTYRVNLKGISGFTLNYVPVTGKDRTVVPIGANVKTNIVIPKLDETVSSPDALFSNNSYLLIQNNSSYSFQLLRGDGIIQPDNLSNSLVTSGWRAQYTINPGGASAYRLLEIGGSYITFSGSLVSFEAGCVYSFIFDNGNISLVSEVEIKLENVAGVSPNKPVPQAPGAPSVTASDGLLTVHWTAVEGAENYEVYLSETQSPPALPERTIYSTVAVLTGLTNKTAYYVWVKAVNENGASGFSPSARGIPWPANESPATPQRPVIIPGVNQLTVNWEETGGASSYEVYISTTTTVPSSATVTTEKTSAVINNLQNNVIYYIWICAVNNRGRSGYSPFEAGTPQIPTAAPFAPARPVLIARNKELAVSWQAVELAASYEVWLGTSSNSVQAQQFGGDVTGGITETIITELTNETTYYVWVKAKNTVGTSGFSLPANARPSAFAVLPETPAMPTVTVGSRELTVNWQAIEGALSYEVWTGATNNSAYAEKYGADITGTSVTLHNLNNGTTYYIWIKAKNNIGASGFSPRASGTPSASSATPPDPQAAPTVTAGSGQLVVSWQAVEGASAYEIWAGTTINPTAATKRGNDVSSTSATITGLSNGTTYYVWIKAKNSVGTSGFSPTASGTPSSFSVVPQAPAAPAVTIGNGQITVSWTAVEGATAYEIWFGTSNSSASAAKNGDDESTSLSRTISGLSNGTTYYFWIKAKNNVGTSGFSPVASGKPIGNASTPIPTSSNGQLSVTWTAIAGADQYEVFYSTGVNPPQTASQTVTITTAAITGLTNGTIYNVWIRGKNATGNGEMSGAASAKPIGNMGTVTLVSGNGQLSLSWSSVAGADEYEVYQNTANSIPASPAHTVTVTTAAISGLTNGTTYYVWVKPKNANGTGGTSTVVSGKPNRGGLYRNSFNDNNKIGSHNLSQALAYISDNAVSGDNYFIVLAENESASGISLNYSGKTVGITLIGEDAEKTITLSSNGSMFTTNAGVTLTLDENITLKGLNTNNAALVYLNSGELIINGGAKISGNTSSSNGGGIYVSGSTSTVTMNGGTITGNTADNGGGVCVYSGTFTMNGGTISENTVDRSIEGGGIYNIIGTVIIHDGTISGNANNGIATSIGTLTINGGTISGNTNDGIFVGSGTVTMNGGIIKENVGKGIYVMDGTVTIHNGTIGGNTNDGNGGGIYVSGTVVMNGGTISGNTVCGIEIDNSGTVTMNAGTISGNTNRGGVYVSSGTFTMRGGTISGNTSSSNGGGVYVGRGQTFKKLPPDGGGQNSGIIYGSEAGVSLRNTGIGLLGSVAGHAVYYDNYSPSARNTTANQTDQIDTTTGIGLSADGNAPYGQ